MGAKDRLACGGALVQPPACPEPPIPPPSERHRHRPLQQYNHHSEFVLGLEWSLFQEGTLASCGWDSWMHVWHRSVHPLPPPAVAR